MSEDSSLKNTYESLLFFGRISASFSHEINNVIAIIGEFSGLVSDLLAATEQGRDVDFSRILDKNQSILNNTKRGEKLIKNFNRFAHSVDDPVKAVDPAEIMEHFAALAQRLVARRNGTLGIDNPGGAEINLETNPFFLMNLVFLIIEDFLNADPDGPEITMSFEARDGWVLLHVKSNRAAGEKEGDAENEKRRGELLDMLNAEMHTADTAEGGREVIISLPA